MVRSITIRRRPSLWLRPALCALAVTMALLVANAALAADSELASDPGAQPDSVDAHLARGREYVARGQYAEAKIEFETVLRFDNLPPDLLSQVRIYDAQAAIQSVP